MPDFVPPQPFTMADMMEALDDLWSHLPHEYAHYLQSETLTICREVHNLLWTHEDADPPQVDADA